MIIILHFLLSTFFFNDSSYLFKSTKFVLILHIVFYIDENIETRGIILVSCCHLQMNQKCIRVNVILYIAISRTYAQARGVLQRMTS